jgi:L-2-hydroxyglutarate oxidase
MFPLRGSYLYPRLDILPSKLKELKTLLYPIPPINSNLFLGNHTTVTLEGEVKFGPTATPMLWRENYQDDFKSFNFNEFAQIVKEGAKCLLSP